jgi:hypothetical protein
MKCLICNNEFKYLVRHLINDHEISGKEYYDKYLKRENEGICVVCGKETVYHERLKKGYSKTCSIKCSRVILMNDSNYRLKADKNKSEISKRNWANNSKRRTDRSKLSKKLWQNDEYRNKMKSEETRNKISATIANGIKNDPQKYCVNKRTKKGWFISKKINNKIYYQSSYEKKFIEIIENDNNVVSFSKPDFSVLYLNPKDNKMHRYIPDFIVDYADGTKRLIEIKSNWQLEDSVVMSKARAARQYCRNFCKNLSYAIYTEDFLF